MSMIVLLSERPYYPRISMLLKTTVSASFSYLKMLYFTEWERFVCRQLDSEKMRALCCWFYICLKDRVEFLSANHPLSWGNDLSRFFCLSDNISCIIFIPIFHCFVACTANWVCPVCQNFHLICFKLYRSINICLFCVLHEVRYSLTVN